MSTLKARPVAADADGRAVIRVLLVDDHALVRQGVEALLDEVEGILVVGEVTDGEAVETAVERLRPDVVLMDLVMPGIDGVAATRALVESGARARVLALSGSGDEEKIFAAVHAGALGFVSKNAGREALIRAIRQVANDEPSLPPELTRQLLRRHGPSANPRSEPLTAREKEILILVASGLSNKQIAGRVHLAVGTVRIHVSNILSKLALANRVEATLWALRSGLVSLEAKGPP